MIIITNYIKKLQTKLMVGTILHAKKKTCRKIKIINIHYTVVSVYIESVKMHPICFLIIYMQLLYILTMTNRHKIKFPATRG